MATTQMNHQNITEELAPKKRSNGRRKIPIETIADKTRKHVTFSKRRSGLFKKASELCALCGVEMAILTFSERGKLFCFGHPDPDDIIRRYVSSECGIESVCDVEDDVTRCNELALMVEDHNRRFEGIKRRIEEEKKFADYQVIIKKEQGQNWNNEVKNYGFWWDEAPVHEMGLDELEQFMACLLELRNNVAKQVDKFTGTNLSFPSVDTTTAPRGILGSNSNMMMVTGKEDTMIDIVTRQSFSFSYMGGMGMEDYSGNKELCQYSNTIPMESLDLNDMNHHHQVAMMEDHKSSLINQDVTPQQTFKYGEVVGKKTELTKNWSSEADHVSAK